MKLLKWPDSIAEALITRFFRRIHTREYRPEFGRGRCATSLALRIA